MSLDTAQTTAGGPPPPPTTQTQPAHAATARVKARRRPWVFALMAALVAAGALGVAFVFTSVNDTQEVLVVSSDIKRGETIEAGDLSVVRVSVDPALTPVPGSQKAELEGSRAAVDLWAGTLLTEQAVADNLVPGEGESLVGISLTPAQMPSEPLYGGDVVRMDSNVHYAGPGGSANMLGLYFADAGQHIEHRLFVDHGEPQCKSNANYRGALQGQGAHTVWVGNVLIREAAGGIETYEENRNLILTDGCHADSVPNLEIETGEIAGAGHASATGRFDDNQLFYLRSRGIEENEARRLVVHGFFNDLIRQIGVEALDEKLREVVEDELEKNVLQAF